MTTTLEAHVDDFDIEVTHLEPATPTQPTTAKEMAAKNSPSYTARSPLARRLSARQRALRVVGASGLVLLAVVLILASLPETRRTVVAFFATPTPTVPPPLLLYADTFYSADAVPWGVISVDGRQEPDLLSQPVEKGGPGLPAFSLPRGRHTLDYHADPFPVLHCVVSVPAAKTDTCPLLTGAAYADTLSALPYASRVLNLSATFDSLPTTQRVALTQTIETALNGTMTTEWVEPGESYRASDGSIAVATERLQAVAVVSVNTDAQRATPSPTGLCVAVCTGQLGTLPNTAWTVSVNAVLHWRYLRADGQTALDAAPSASTSADEHVLAQLNIQRANGAWVVPDPVPLNIVRGSLTCAVGLAMKSRLIASFPPPQLAYMFVWDVSDIRAGAQVPDCLLIGSKQMNPDGRPVGTLVVLLYRCGLLLAANDTARQVFPQLPSATPAEQALAIQMSPVEVASATG